MKRKAQGGYPTWQCRKCGGVFTAGFGLGYRRASDIDIYHHSLAVHDDNGWHHNVLYRTHKCQDGGEGLADFIGLSPSKLNVKWVGTFKEG